MDHNKLHKLTNSIFAELSPSGSTLLGRGQTHVFSIVET